MLPSCLLFTNQIGINVLMLFHYAHFALMVKEVQEQKVAGLWKQVE